MDSPFTWMVGLKNMFDKIISELRIRLCVPALTDMSLNPDERDDFRMLYVLGSFCTPVAEKEDKSNRSALEFAYLKCTDDDIETELNARKIITKGCCERWGHRNLDSFQEEFALYMRNILFTSIPENRNVNLNELTEEQRTQRDGIKLPTWMVTRNPTEEEMDWGLCKFAATKLAYTDGANKEIRDALILALCTIATQGQASTVWCSKFNSEIASEFGESPNLLPEKIRNFWPYLRQRISSEAVEELCARWDNMFHGKSQRMSLLIQRMAWKHLTCYSSIRQAMTMFPEFDWNKLFTRVPHEKVNLDNAIELIGENQFFGYNKDLSAVQITQYPNVAWCALQLLQKVGGNRALVRYQGLDRKRISEELFIDVLIKEFINYRVVKKMSAIASTSRFH